MGLFNKPLDHLDFSGSVYSTAFLYAENAVEKRLGIHQTEKQKQLDYSYWKGGVSVCVKTIFCPFAATASLVEGVVRLIFSGFAYVASFFCDSMNDVPGNLFDSAVSFDRPNGGMSATQAFIISVALPITEFLVMIPKIWEAIFVKTPKGVT